MKKAKSFLSIILHIIQAQCALTFSPHFLQRPTPTPNHHIYLNPNNAKLTTASPLSSPLSSPSSSLSAATPRNDYNSDERKYEYYRPQARGVPKGGDMAYMEENVRRCAETFKSIRQVGGVDSTNDVYARGNNRFEYWYIGKIARTTGTVTLNQGISKVWNLLEEHACRLRPVELGREFGELEIWCSQKGDTEIKLSQATATSGDSVIDDDMSLTKMEKYVEGGDEVSNLEVGFIAEVVTNKGQGFYIIRDDRGNLMQ